MVKCFHEDKSAPEREKKFKEMKEIQKPDLKENKIIVGKAMKEDITDQDLVVDWYDSNMYDGSEVYLLDFWLMCY